MEKIREPGSAITHFIGMISAIIATAPLLLKAHRASNPVNMSAMTIFIVSMILLYGASTAYHSVMLPDKFIRIFRKVDHMMIFILIAGSYTPVCLIVLGGKLGNMLLSIVWSIAIVGIFIKAFWITCPKWFSSALYIAMGWTCLLAFTQIRNALAPDAFFWLVAGGVIYTVGGIIYALKLPLFNRRHKAFGSHEIFHLFVMGGSICHFIFMYQFLALM